MTQPTFASTHGVALLLPDDSQLLTVDKTLLAATRSARRPTEPRGADSALPLSGNGESNRRRHLSPPVGRAEANTIVVRAHSQQ